jgi:hypothetical protein
MRWCSTSVGATPVRHSLAGKTSSFPGMSRRPRFADRERVHGHWHRLCGDHDRVRRLGRPRRARRHGRHDVLEAPPQGHRRHAAGRGAESEGDPRERHRGKLKFDPAKSHGSKVRGYKATCKSTSGLVASGSSDAAAQGGGPRTGCEVPLHRQGEEPLRLWARPRRRHAARLAPSEKIAA